MAPLPVFKLLYIGAKQIAKPISQRIVSLARSSEFTKQKIVIPIGQGSNWVWVRLQRIADGSARKTVRALPEAEAVDLGGVIIAETFIFSVAAFFIVWEYRDKDKKEAIKKAETAATMEKLFTTLEQHHQRQEKLEAQLNEILQRTSTATPNLPTERTGPSYFSAESLYGYIPGISMVSSAVTNLTYMIMGSPTTSDGQSGGQDNVVAIDSTIEVGETS
eukprot:m.70664 g.70664  ORF g.70664 m.70664 type:complete len:219 (-) comp12151_c0_seq3:135-791(-)